MARGKCDLERAIIIPTEVLETVLGWTKNRTKRWLMRHGILRKAPTGRYGRTYTTAPLIQQAFPETAALILSRISDNDRKPSSWLKAAV